MRRILRPVGALVARSVPPSWLSFPVSRPALHGGLVFDSSRSVADGHSSLEPVQSSTAPASAAAAAAAAAAAPTQLGFRAHAHILQGICRSHDPPVNKRRRVHGVVRKLEERHIEWLGELHIVNPAASGRDCAALLAALRTARPFLHTHRLQRSGGANNREARHFIPAEEAESDWTGVSPYFLPEVSDALCLCLRLSSEAYRDRPDKLLVLLDCAVSLELGDTEAMQTLVIGLTARDHCANCSAHELVDTLRLLSLAVKRCKLQPPPLDHIFCRLPSEKAISPRESLHVLSSLVRLRNNQRAVEVGSAVSRNAVSGVPEYGVKDVVFGLEAVAILNVCHETYAAAVLDRCTDLAPVMSTKELGDVCKYVGLLQPHRPTNNVALSCGREMRRVLPALEARAEQLLGTFSLRDARYVLRCFSQHKARHSILLSRLTPYANDS